MSTATPADRRALRDLVEGLYSQGVMASVISTIIGTVIVGVMWHRIEHPLLLSWFGLVLINQAARAVLVGRFRRLSASSPDPATWLRRYAWTMAAGGAIFGSVAFLLFPEHDPLAQAFLVVLVFGLASGALSANAYYRPALIAHLVLILSPMILRLALEGGAEYGALTFTTAFGLLVLLAFGLRQSRILHESIALRYRNLDLIEQLKAKSALAVAAQQRAEQASLAKSQFFAAASHDLRQPLQALGLYVSSFREMQRDPHDARTIEQIQASVDSLESLFDEILDISRLDAGDLQPAHSHFALRRVFDRLATNFAPVARSQGLALEFHGGEAAVLGDPVLLERLLGNLVSNALRYTRQGRITVGARSDGERVVLEVADTGIGIPREAHDRIFDEFTQLGNPERDRRRGLGLGLAIVRRIARLLDYPLSLESEPGRGSTFRIGARAGDAALAQGAGPDTALADANALARHRIAIVEDDAGVREGLVQLLLGWGCEVTAAASSAEALARLEDRPHVLIADYRLGAGEDGMSAIDALRRRFGADLPAVVITGDASPEVFAAALARRLPVLTKPVRAARLRAALTSLAARPRTAEAA